MLEKIKALEAVARQLQPPAEQRQVWTQAMLQYTEQFLDKLEELPAFVLSQDQGRGLLQADIREEGRSFEELLALIQEHVDTPGANPASPGLLAYIPGGGIFPAAIGDYLAAVTDRYAGIFFSGPGAVRMENQLIRWMCQLVGFPDTALGNLTSGGSISNLAAIATARDHMKVRSADVERSVIYLSHQAHHSVQKALRIAGLGEAHLHYLPIDERFRIDAGALRRAIEADKAQGLRPFLVVASAGTTDTGAIDPLDEVGDIAHEHGLWYHVDAAYGGFFLLCPDWRPHFKGIEKADSVTIDPHKSLFLPYGTGALLIKNIEALSKTHYYVAGYMQDAADATEEPSPADLSPELTKHFRGLRMWLPLQLFGVQPFRAALEEKIWLTRYFYERIGELGFERGPYPELSVTIYRYVPEEGDANAFNARLIAGAQQDGRVFLSSTTIDGVYWLRMAILNFRSHLDIVETSLKVLEEQLALQLQQPTTV
ncbi:MAG: aminotransferase class V-fold PLP-dependent enzyme [Bacteroidota bacterium]